MAVLINLLPDVRQAKLRESHRRQLVSGVSIVIWVVCGAVVVLLSIYAAGQKVIINSDTHSITNEEEQLKAVPGIVDAYTAQQHLASLPGLYGQRAYLSKFLQVYQQADPTDVSLESMTIDATNTLTVEGQTKSYAEVAKLARALAASNVTVGSSASVSNSPNFTNINITELTNDGKNVAFSITATVQSGATSGSGQ